MCIRDSDVIIDSGSVYVFRPQDGFTVVKALSGTTCGESNAVGRKVLVSSALAATRCCGSIIDSYLPSDASADNSYADNFRTYAATDLPPVRLGFGASGSLRVSVRRGFA